MPAKKKSKRRPPSRFKRTWPTDLQHSPEFCLWVLQNSGPLGPSLKVSFSRKRGGRGRPPAFSEQTVSWAFIPLLRHAALYYARWISQVCRAISDSRTSQTQRERMVAKVFAGWPKSVDADRLALLTIRKPRAAVPGIIKLFRGVTLKQRALEKHDRLHRDALRPRKLYDLRTLRPAPKSRKSLPIQTPESSIAGKLQEYAVAYRRP